MRTEGKLTANQVLKDIKHIVERVSEVILGKKAQLKPVPVRNK
jgi:hypothetical protein